MPRRRPSIAPTTEAQVLDERIARTERLIARMQQAGTVSIQTIDKESYPDPTQGEVVWHWVSNRGYIWHLNRWHPLLPPTYEIKVFPDDQLTLTGVGQFKWALPKELDGMDLYDAEAYVTTAGSAVSVMIRNNTKAVDMLSTPLTIDAGTKHTRYAATQRVIDLANDDVEWADEISIDVVSGGGTYGLGVKAIFNYNIT